MKCRRDNKDHYNETHKIWARNKTKERLEKGLCTKCGAEKDDDGYKTCIKCRYKSAKYKREHYDGLSRYQKQILGICYYCKSPVVPGLKVCEECRQRCIQNQSHVDRSKHVWALRSVGNGDNEK